jgi:hypothetical protein
MPNENDDDPRWEESDLDLSSLTEQQPITLSDEPIGDAHCPHCLSRQEKLPGLWLEDQSTAFGYVCENCGKIMRVEVFFTPTFRISKNE